MPELSPENRIGVTVDRALCIGSGDCVDTAPDVFQLDEEDKAVVVDPDGASVDDIVTAAGNCPVSAISWWARRATSTRRRAAPRQACLGAWPVSAAWRASAARSSSGHRRPRVDRERLAVLVADPLGLVARLDEHGERVQVGVQARRAHHDRAGAARELAQLVGERGQLAELDDVVGRELLVAEPLGDGGRNRVRRRRDLLLTEIEDRMDDRLALEVRRDVDVLPFHLSNDSIGQSRPCHDT